ncbi:MAG: acyl-ACP--UDP-N-acetylglucosamine O-acyltransferase [Hyphomonadaceae bacterium]|nr:acyl-ACP--UDP-N-acetylglucosamine O-acyltransferase [Hyphomonadaceae bacterium]
MSTGVHPTALVDPSAEIHGEAQIGPYCIVGPNVRLAAGVRLVAHVFIERETAIGEGTVVHPYATLGQPAQDTSYKGEPTTLVIGARNTIREHVSMHRGTVRGRGTTIVGDDGFFMAQSHVAHDCVVGSGVIFAQGATLGGHVQVGDHVIMGGLSAMHQHGRIGRHAFVGGLAAVVADVIPYGSVFGNHASLAGLNVVGLKRRGFSREAVHDLRAAYRLLFAEEGTFQERLDDVAETYAHEPLVQEIVAFIRADAQRPLCMPKA